MSVKKTALLIFLYRNPECPLMTRMQHGLQDNIWVHFYCLIFGWLSMLVTIHHSPPIHFSFFLIFPLLYLLIQYSFCSNKHHMLCEQLLFRHMDVGSRKCNLLRKWNLGQVKRLSTPESGPDPHCCFLLADWAHMGAQPLKMCSTCI